MLYSGGTLPSGWRRLEVQRKNGTTLKHFDVYYYAPDGTKIRSFPDVEKYFEEHKNLKLVDRSCFNFTPVQTRKVVDSDGEEEPICNALYRQKFEENISGSSIDYFSIDQERASEIFNEGFDSSALGQSVVCMQTSRGVFKPRYSSSPIQMPKRVRLANANDYLARDQREGVQKRDCSTAEPGSKRRLKIVLGGKRNREGSIDSCKRKKRLKRDKELVKRQQNEKVNSSNVEGSNEGPKVESTALVDEVRACHASKGKKKVIKKNDAGKRPLTERRKHRSKTKMVESKTGEDERDGKTIEGSACISPKFKPESLIPIEDGNESGKKEEISSAKEEVLESCKSKGKGHKIEANVTAKKAHRKVIKGKILKVKMQQKVNKDLSAKVISQEKASKGHHMVTRRCQKAVCAEHINKEKQEAVVPTMKDTKRENNTLDDAMTVSPQNICVEDDKDKTAKISNVARLVCKITPPAKASRENLVVRKRAIKSRIKVKSKASQTTNDDRLNELMTAKGETKKSSSKNMNHGKGRAESGTGTTESANNTQESVCSDYSELCNTDVKETTLDEIFSDVNLQVSEAMASEIITDTDANLRTGLDLRLHKLEFNENELNKEKQTKGSKGRANEGQTGKGQPNTGQSKRQRSEGKGQADHGKKSEVTKFKADLFVEDLPTDTSKSETEKAVSTTAGRTSLGSSNDRGRDASDVPVIHVNTVESARKTGSKKIQATRYQSLAEEEFSKPDSEKDDSIQSNESSIDVRLQEAADIHDWDAFRKAFPPVSRNKPNIAVTERKSRRISAMRDANTFTETSSKEPPNVGQGMVGGEHEICEDGQSDVIKIDLQKFEGSHSTIDADDVLKSTQHTNKDPDTECRVKDVGKLDLKRASGFLSPITPCDDLVTENKTCRTASSVTERDIHKGVRSRKNKQKQEDRQGPKETVPSSEKAINPVGERSLSLLYADVISKTEKHLDVITSSAQSKEKLDHGRAETEADCGVIKPGKKYSEKVRSDVSPRVLRRRSESKGNVNNEEEILSNGQRSGELTSAGSKPGGTPLTSQKIETTPSKAQKGVTTPVKKKSAVKEPSAIKEVLKIQATLKSVKKTPIITNKTVSFSDLWGQCHKQKDTRESIFTTRQTKKRSKSLTTQCCGKLSGWTRVATQRQCGESSGTWDVMYFAPCGKRFRSRPEIAKYIATTKIKGISVELFCFSGRILNFDNLKNDIAAIRRRQPSISGIVEGTDTEDSNGAKVLKGDVGKQKAVVVRKRVHGSKNDVKEIDKVLDKTSSEKVNDANNEMKICDRTNNKKEGNVCQTERSHTRRSSRFCSIQEEGKKRSTKPEKKQNDLKTKPDKKQEGNKASSNTGQDKLDQSGSTGRSVDVSIYDGKSAEADVSPERKANFNAKSKLKKNIENSVVKSPYFAVAKEEKIAKTRKHLKDVGLQLRRSRRKSERLIPKESAKERADVSEAATMDLPKENDMNEEEQTEYTCEEQKDLAMTGKDSSEQASAGEEIHKKTDTEAVEINSKEAVLVAKLDTGHLVAMAGNENLGIDNDDRKAQAGDESIPGGVGREETLKLENINDRESQRTTSNSGNGFIGEVTLNSLLDITRNETENTKKERYGSDDPFANNHAIDAGSMSVKANDQDGDFTRPLNYEKRDSVAKTERENLADVVQNRNEICSDHDVEPPLEITSEEGLDEARTASRDFELKGEKQGVEVMKSRKARLTKMEQFNEAVRPDQNVETSFKITSEERLDEARTASGDFEQKEEKQVVEVMKSRKARLTKTEQISDSVRPDQNVETSFKIISEERPDEARSANRDFEKIYEKQGAEESKSRTEKLIDRKQITEEISLDRNIEYSLEISPEEISGESKTANRTPEQTGKKQGVEVTTPRRENLTDVEQISETVKLNQNMETAFEIILEESPEDTRTENRNYDQKDHEQGVSVKVMSNLATDYFKSSDDDNALSKFISNKGDRGSFRSKPDTRIRSEIGTVMQKLLSLGNERHEDAETEKEEIKGQFQLVMDEDSYNDRTSQGQAKLDERPRSSENTEISKISGGETANLGLFEISRRHSDSDFSRDIDRITRDKDTFSSHFGPENVELAADRGSSLVATELTPNEPDIHSLAERIEKKQATVIECIDLTTESDEHSSQCEANPAGMFDYTEGESNALVELAKLTKSVSSTELETAAAAKSESSLSPTQTAELAHQTKTSSILKSTPTQKSEKSVVSADSETLDIPLESEDISTCITVGKPIAVTKTGDAATAKLSETSLALGNSALAEKSLKETITEAGFDEPTTLDEYLEKQTVQKLAARTEPADSLPLSNPKVTKPALSTESADLLPLVNATNSTKSMLTVVPQADDKEFRTLKFDESLDTDIAVKTTLFEERNGIVIQNDCHLRTTAADKEEKGFGVRTQNTSKTAPETVTEETMIGFENSSSVGEPGMRPRRVSEGIVIRTKDSLAVSEQVLRPNRMAGETHSPYREDNMIKKINELLGGGTNENKVDRDSTTKFGDADAKDSVSLDLECSETMRDSFDLSSDAEKPADCSISCSEISAKGDDTKSQDKNRRSIKVDAQVYSGGEKVAGCTTGNSHISLKKAGTKFEDGQDKNGQSIKVDSQVYSGGEKVAECTTGNSDIGLKKAGTNLDDGQDKNGQSIKIDSQFSSGAETSAVFTTDESEVNLKEVSTNLKKGQGKNGSSIKIDSQFSSGAKKLAEYAASDSEFSLKEAGTDMKESQVKKGWCTKFDSFVGKKATLLPDTSDDGETFAECSLGDSEFVLTKGQENPFENEVSADGDNGVCTETNTMKSAADDVRGSAVRGNDVKRQSSVCSRKGKSAMKKWKVDLDEENQNTPEKCSSSLEKLQSIVEKIKRENSCKIKRRKKTPKTYPLTVMTRKQYKEEILDCLPKPEVRKDSKPSEQQLSDVKGKRERKISQKALQYMQERDQKRRVSKKIEKNEKTNKSGKEGNGNNVARECFMMASKEGSLTKANGRASTRRQLKQRAPIERKDSSGSGKGLKEKQESKVMANEAEAGQGENKRNTLSDSSTIASKEESSRKAICGRISTRRRSSGKAAVERNDTKGTGKGLGEKQKSVAMDDGTKAEKDEQCAERQGNEKQKLGYDKVRNVIKFSKKCETKVSSHAGMEMTKRENKIIEHGKEGKQSVRLKRREVETDLNEIVEGSNRESKLKDGKKIARRSRVITQQTTEKKGAWHPKKGSRSSGLYESEKEEALRGFSKEASKGRGGVKSKQESIQAWNEEVRKEAAEEADKVRRSLEEVAVTEISKAVSKNRESTKSSRESIQAWDEEAKEREKKDVNKARNKSGMVTRKRRHAIDSKKEKDDQDDVGGSEIDHLSMEMTKIVKATTQGAWNEAQGGDMAEGKGGICESSPRDSTSSNQTVGRRKRSKTWSEDQGRVSSKKFRQGCTFHIGLTDTHITRDDYGVIGSLHRMEKIPKRTILPSNVLHDNLDFVSKQAQPNVSSSAMCISQMEGKEKRHNCDAFAQKRDTGSIFQDMLHRSYSSETDRMSSNMLVTSGNTFDFKSPYFSRRYEANTREKSLFRRRMKLDTDSGKLARISLQEEVKDDENDAEMNEEGDFFTDTIGRVSLDHDYLQHVENEGKDSLPHIENKNEDSVQHIENEDEHGDNLSVDKQDKEDIATNDRKSPADDATEEKITLECTELFRTEDAEGSNQWSKEMLSSSESKEGEGDASRAVNLDENKVSQAENKASSNVGSASVKSDEMVCFTCGASNTHSVDEEIATLASCRDCSGRVYAAYCGISEYMNGIKRQDCLQSGEERQFNAKFSSGKICLSRKQKFFMQLGLCTSNMAKSSRRRKDSIKTEKDTLGTEREAEGDAFRVGFERHDYGYGATVHHSFSEECLHRVGPQRPERKDREGKSPSPKTGGQSINDNDDPKGHSAEVNKPPPREMKNLQRIMKKNYRRLGIQREHTSEEYTSKSKRVLSPYFAHSIQNRRSLRLAGKDQSKKPTMLKSRRRARSPQKAAQEDATKRSVHDVRQKYLVWTRSRTAKLNQKQNSSQQISVGRDKHDKRAVTANIATTSKAGNASGLAVKEGSMRGTISCNPDNTQKQMGRRRKEVPALLPPECCGKVYQLQDDRSNFVGCVFGNRSSNSRNKKRKHISVTYRPPKSPHGLIQERLYRDPWRLLVSTIFLNRTKGTCSIPIMWKFLELWPNPETAMHADWKEISGT